MPRISVNGTELYYEDTGPASSGEALVFSHGLLFDTGLFAPQMAAFRDRYRCIAYDHRGQGQSADSPLRVIDMDLLTDDAAELIRKLNLGRVHFCGLSMGGFVGMRLAARRPELLRSLILLDTSADAEPAGNLPKYRTLNFVARWIGLWAVVGKVMPIMFARSTLNDPARRDEIAAWRRRLAANRRSIWRAVNGVLERTAIYPELGKVRTPTLVAVGEEDVATVPEKAERIRAAIAGARLERIPKAGHSSTLEQPVAVNAMIAAFLSHVPPAM